MLAQRIKHDIPARPSTQNPCPVWRLTLWAAIAALLIAPAVAMQVTREVRWGGEDFIAAALLLGAFGMGVELAMRFVARSRPRLLACAVISGAALCIWADAAVGVF